MKDGEGKMLVGDIIYSDTVDMCCKYRVFSGQWKNGGIELHSSDSGHRPTCSVLDKTITAVDVDKENECIIIECE